MASNWMGTEKKLNWNEHWTTKNKGIVRAGGKAEGVKELSTIPYWGWGGGKQNISKTQRAGKKQCAQITSNYWIHCCEKLNITVHFKVVRIMDRLQICIMSISLLGFFLFTCLLVQTSYYCEQYSLQSSMTLWHFGCMFHCGPWQTLPHIKVVPAPAELRIVPTSCTLCVWVCLFSWWAGGILYVRLSHHVCTWIFECWQKDKKSA